MDNYFDLYSSKVRRVNIPLPSFRYFHKASSDEEVDPKFIGRKKISDKLYSWLLSDDKGGSYLITGFRGMGKSSFVGRVLNELTQKVSGKEFFWGVLFFVFIFIMGVLLIPVIYGITKNNDEVQLTHNFCLFIITIIIVCFNYIIIDLMQSNKNTDKSIFVGITIIAFFISYHCLSFVNLYCRFVFFICLCILPLLLYKVKSILYKAHNEDKKKHEDFLSLLEDEYKNIPETSKDFQQFYDEKKEKIDWKRVCRVLYREYNINRSYQRICISVNLGQEVLNERDVLSLISHQLYTKYREYVLSPIANFSNWLIYTILIFISTYPLCTYKEFINKGEIKLNFINISDGIILLSPIAIILVFYFVSLLYSSSQTRILCRLHLLNNRLDAQVTFNEAYMAGIGKPDLKSAYSRAGYTKKRFYDVAKVREIEQELIDILNNISKTFWKRKKSPSFIFVFDELDKVDSSSLQGYAFDNQTEFSNEKNFPGGGTTRQRKRNVLHLLANMKLFISTAKAKFIFISGRELYDAYLADLSDREFAVSSIFSGVIYVDSFCVNEYKGKDVMSNVEKFICKQLMPQKYIHQQFARQYILELVKDTNPERFDIDLRLYHKYLVEQYSMIIKDFAKPTVDRFDKKKIHSHEELQKILCRYYIDKTINLLYHFSVYLYHISNGSPKKMMLHFEKYVRATSENDNLRFSDLSESCKVDPKSPIYIYNSEKADYYLSFGYMDQRTIGFIHYISFPINQILVNANQYSDKLLVSVSFLIDHIYKFHNGGFSWRNLEYTPELLEVYKIPGFRGFINSIISYLQQTHIVSVSCGLYQFKFRKKIAEEIALASRFSEEIAALFNFTLDESRNIKQHYSDIRESYLALEGKGDKQAPRLSIGLHNILGDLYLFDEEINNAILEYHAAINELEKEIKNDNKQEPNLDNMLYLIRLLLKLGLANEKRNTNETAYLTYSNLTSNLLGFRHFNEQDLQLTYRLRRSGEWPTYEGVIFPKKYDRLRDFEFNLVHPNIVTNSHQIYKTDNEFMAYGQQLSSIFAHLLTPEKYSIIQRISLFQDIRLVYQALLAKLFVKEKMNLGGITLTDLEIIESEYLYLNLASNVKEKFLTSSDFFRRLGDIMYYKNGLTAPEYEKYYDSFVEGLTYWGVDIKREILDYCNINKSYQKYEKIREHFYNKKNDEIDSKNDSVYKVLEKIKQSFEKNGIENFLLDDRFKKISADEVIACNKHRERMFKKNTPIPCHACKYYNRSLRTLMKGMFGCDVLEEKHIKQTNNVFIVLEKILDKGTSHSLRQENVIQLAEILDCKGNIQLCCTTDNTDGDNQNVNHNIISEVFMNAFINDIRHSESVPGKLNFGNDSSCKEKSQLYSYYTGSNAKRIYKLEESILYFWEASVCFAIANELMKASASLKKILRIMQNYLKTANVEEIDSRKEIVGKYIGQLKDYIIKPCLVYLYSHYNNINKAEIRILKWIFSVKMYDDIPLNSLSLFPDVEHIMILYYDLLRRCSINDNSTAKKLSTIYYNPFFSSLRQEGTTYERVMSLRFKVLMNLEFLKIIFGKNQEIFYLQPDRRAIGFVDVFFKYLDNQKSLKELLRDFNYSFWMALCYYKNNPNKNEGEKCTSDFAIKLHFLEFLTKDSLYCISRIIEILTPRSSTTLFTNSFYGEVYQMLYEWTDLFYSIFSQYNFFDKYTKIEKDDDSITLCIKNKNVIIKIGFKDSEGTIKTELKRNKITKSSTLDARRLTRIIGLYANQMDVFQEIESYKQIIKDSMSTHFFDDIMVLLGKTQVNYTMVQYPISMAIESYKNALKMHHEGKTYKELISQMHYLNDDLKNDTISFGAAVERYKINTGYINRQKEKLESLDKKTSLEDIEKFGQEVFTSMDISDLLPHHLPLS